MVTLNKSKSTPDLGYELVLIGQNKYYTDEVWNNPEWRKEPVIKKYVKDSIKLKIDSNPASLLRGSKKLFTYHLYNVKKLFVSGVSVLDLYKSRLMIYRYSNLWKNYRMFMGFPSNGQRTWSNAKTSKKRLNHVRAWEEYLSSRKFNFICPPEVLRKLCHMEFLNKLWNQQWHHEWVAAREYLNRYETRYRYKSWRFGFTFALKNRPLTYYQNPFKKIKKNKRKVTLPANQINVGLPKNFGVKYVRRIFSSSLWKERKVVLL